MAGPVLVPCLVTLREEINERAPRRSKKSDGWIGDPAHQETVSDHNDDEVGNVPIRDADKKREVHALDVDADLNEPGFTMDDLVDQLVRQARAGDKRLRYIIWNRRIWKAAAGWPVKGQPYIGDNPHTKHAHFSGSYNSEQEARTDTWHVYQQEAPMTVPTAGQNADAVKAADVDPGSGTYSLGGAIWTTLQRSGAVPAQFDDLDARVQDVDDELDGLGASLILLVSLVQQVTGDPGVDTNVWYDVMRAAVKDELNARGITGPTAQ